jgi:hypothetical protein
MFFLQALSENPDPCVTGTVVEVKSEKLQVWVPSWNRLVSVKKNADLDLEEEIHISQKVRLSYYVHYQNARWKDKIVFNLSLV